jgi:hypothetical protein
MKIGTTIFLAFLILISFGYVISDDQSAHRRLAEVSGQVDSLGVQLDQANQKLSSCQETVKNDQVTISQQGVEMDALKTAQTQQIARIDQLATQVTKCENTRTQVSQTSGNSSNSDPLISIAIVIALAGLAMLQIRQEKKMSFQMPRTGQPEKGEYVRLTREELDQLVNMRRMKKP